MAALYVKLHAGALAALVHTSLVFVLLLNPVVTSPAALAPSQPQAGVAAAAAGLLGSAKAAPAAPAALAAQAAQAAQATKATSESKAANALPTTAQAAVAGGVAASPAGGPSVRTVQLPSPIRRAVWLGSSNATCDAKCQQDCLGLGNAEDARGAWHGDAVGSQLDFCLARCGCAGGADRLFVLTEDGSAHLWTAAGNAWTSLPELIPAKELTPHGGPNFRVRQLHPSLADPRVVVALTNTAASWLSKDGGASWHPVTVALKGGEARRLSGWLWHPSEKAWALAEAVPRSRTAHEKRRRSTVYYTQDSGATWKLLAKDVEQCQWSVKSAANKSRVVLTRYVDSANVAGESSEVELLDTSDFMATHRSLIGAEAAKAGNPRSAVRAHIRGAFTVAVVGPGGAPAGASVSTGLELWLAYDDGRHAVPRFEAALWPGHVEPLRAGQLRRLKVVHATEKLVLLFVPASDVQLPWGHVFGWTPGRPELELLLTDVQNSGAAVTAAVAAAGADRGLAFHAVAGVDGVLLANRMVLAGQADLDHAERRFDQQTEAARDEDADAEEEKEGEEEATGQRYAVRTYISVNQGQAWQPLRAPPATAAVAPPTECVIAQAGTKNPCSLHLARWLSAAAAPGVLLGIGNAGLRLSENPEHHSVFLSRDAGLTWRAVLAGPHVVSILGHGDALLAAPTRVPGKLVYSVDSGEHWQEVAIKGALAATVLQSVFTHPAHTDLRGFVSLGSDASASTELAALDLSSALSAGACRLPEAASSEASDFENWSPADALEDSHESKRPSCLFGMRTKYTRRKAGKACRTGVSLPGPLDSRIDVACGCTAMDWACDAGYHRASYAPGAPCELLEGAALPNVTAMCEVTLAETVSVTGGYVKLPGNGCSGGVDLSPKLESCPGNVGFAGAMKSFSSRLLSLRMLSFFTTAILLMGLWQNHKNPDPWTAKLRRCYGSAGDIKKKHDDFDDERDFLLPGSADDEL